MLPNQPAPGFPLAAPFGVGPRHGAPHEPEIPCVYTVPVSNSPETWIPADQAPIGRVIGKRITPPPGRLPSAEARAAMDANTRHRTRVPKGVIFYADHEAMIRDGERWTVEAILQKQRERA